MLWHGFFLKKGMLFEKTKFVPLSLYQQIRANDDEVQKSAGPYMSEKLSLICIICASPFFKLFF